MAAQVAQHPRHQLLQVATHSVIRRGLGRPEAGNVEAGVVVGGEDAEGDAGEAVLHQLLPHHLGLGHVPERLQGLLARLAQLAPGLLLLQTGPGVWGCPHLVLGGRHERWRG